MVTEPGAEAISAGRLSQPWRVTALLALAILAARFLFTTLPARLACSDDAVIENALRHRTGSLGDGIFVRWAMEQGRFYFAVPGYRLPYWEYQVDSPVLFSLGRTVLLFLSFGLLGGLLARLLRNEAAGWLYALVAIGMLHLPSVPYPVLSYPAYAVGGIALLLALHCFITSLEDRRPRWLLLGGLFHVGALFCQENFLIFTLLYPLLALVRAGKQTRAEQVASAFPYVALSAAYAVVYLAFRHLHPSGYGGTEFSPRLGASLASWSRQTFAALPGFELLVNRAAPYPNVGPFWKSAPQIRDLFLALPALGWLTALGLAAVASGLAARAARGPRPDKAIIVACAVAAGLPNLIPSLSLKYQESAHHRYYPYVYSFTAYQWLIGAALVVWLLWSIRPAGAAPRPFPAAGVFGGLVGALFLSAAASNLHTVVLLKGWFN